MSDSRVESYLTVSTGGHAKLPNEIGSNVEAYLAYMVGKTNTYPAYPKSAIEEYLEELILSGFTPGGGGSSGGGDSGSFDVEILRANIDINFEVLTFLADYVNTRTYQEVTLENPDQLNGHFIIDPVTMDLVINVVGINDLLIVKENAVEILSDAAEQIDINVEVVDSADNASL